MTQITHRTVKANGINLHVAEAGEGPLVLMLHGFPELWYSYRHQLPALAAAGYHAVAPDRRGHGESDKPQEIEAYSMREMINDALGILDALGEEQAVIVGHDWGAPIAWNSAALHPGRYRAVVGLSVPFLPRSPMPPTTMFKAIFQDKFFYMLYFQEPGVAEAEFEADVRKSMWYFMYGASGEIDRNTLVQAANKPSTAKFFDGIPQPPALPKWLSEEELAYYVRAYEKYGFRGALNRYRCMDFDWNDMPELQDAKIQQPALFIGGDKDPVLTFAPMDPMKAAVANLRTVMLPGIGHWIQQEAPEDVNRELIGFLDGL